MAMHRKMRRPLPDSGMSKYRDPSVTFVSFDVPDGAQGLSGVRISFTSRHAAVSPDDGDVYGQGVVVASAGAGHLPVTPVGRDEVDRHGGSGSYFQAAAEWDEDGSLEGAVLDDPKLDYVPPAGAGKYTVAYVGYSDFVAVDVTGADVRELSFGHLVEHARYDGAALTLRGLRKIAGPALRSFCRSWRPSDPITDDDGANYFAYHEELSEVSLPKYEAVTRAMFEGCTRLATVDFYGAWRIGDSAFLGCTMLTDLSGDQFANATDVGPAAFRECNGLTKVALPSCTRVGSNAFSYCPALHAVALSSRPYLMTRPVPAPLSQTPRDNPDDFPYPALCIGSQIFDHSPGVKIATIPTDVRAQAQNEYTCSTGFRKDMFCSLAQYSGGAPAGDGDDGDRTYFQNRPRFVVLVGARISDLLSEVRVTATGSVGQSSVLDASLNSSYATVTKNPDGTTSSIPIGGAPFGNPEVVTLATYGPGDLVNTTKKLMSFPYGVDGCKTIWNGSTDNSYLAVAANEHSASMVTVVGDGAQSYAIPSRTVVVDRSPEPVPFSIPSFMGVGDILDEFKKMAEARSGSVYGITATDYGRLLDKIGLPGSRDAVFEVRAEDREAISEIPMGSPVGDYDYIYVTTPTWMGPNRPTFVCSDGVVMATTLSRQRIVVTWSRAFLSKAGTLNNTDVDRSGNIVGVVISMVAGSPAVGGSEPGNGDVDGWISYKPDGWGEAYDLWRRHYRSGYMAGPANRRLLYRRTMEILRDTMTRAGGRKTLIQEYFRHEPSFLADALELRAKADMGSIFEE